jgi:hypothetical protein
MPVRKVKEKSQQPAEAVAEQTEQPQAPPEDTEAAAEAQPAAGEQIAPGVQDDGTPTPPARVWTVRALQAFGDARTNRSYKPGDVVIGWDAARASRYAARGLVVIEEASDERADHGDDGGDAGPGA